MGLKACLNQARQTVQEHLEKVFKTYGLPDEMLMDNGKPWGHTARHRHTKLTVWLMELGITICHSRPFHPQTLGKDERFHRTFKDAIQSDCEQQMFEDCQSVFDEWRREYNHIRPHEALDMDVPAKRYCGSEREWPETIPRWTYSTNCEVRTVGTHGYISYEGRHYPIGSGFTGKRVALKETNETRSEELTFDNFK